MVGSEECVLLSSQNKLGQFPSNVDIHINKEERQQQKKTSERLEIGVFNGPFPRKVFNIFICERIKQNVQCAV